MNRLDRFRFGQLHKRRIVAFIIILAVALMLAGGFLGVLGIFGQRSEFVRVKLGSDLSGPYNSGIGVNLTDIPSANRIEDASFEPGHTYREFTVADTSGDIIFLENSDELPMIDTSLPSRIRVLSVGSDGIMTETYSGRMTGFDEAGLGRALEAEDPRRLIGSEAPLGLEYTEGRYVVLTAAGEIVTGVFTDVPELIVSEEVFIDMCLADGTLYFLSETGKIYISSDGVGISQFLSFDPLDAQVLSLEVIGDTVCVLTSDGQIVSLLSDGTVRYTDINVPSGEESEDISAYPVSTAGEDLMAVGYGSSVWLTRNGIFFTEVGQVVPYIGTRTIIDATYVDGSFRFLCSDSSVVRLTVTDNGISCFRDDINGLHLTGICGTETGLLTAVSDDGRAVILEGDRYREIEPSGMTVDRIYTGSSARLPVFGGGRLFLASILSGIQVNQPIPSDSILEGDMCIVETVADEISCEWNTIGDDTAFTITDSCSASMAYSACVSGQSEGQHAIWCDIGKSEDFFSPDNFYRISLQMRGIDMQDKDIYVWISGSEGAFGNTGFSVTGLTDRFSEQSYVFAVTDNMIREGEDLRLNIAWSGNGMLYIDDLYLGEDKYDINEMPSSFTDVMAQTAPAAMRLESLTFASEGFSENRYYSAGIDSLENALRLTRDSGSSPWLVIGSYADREGTDELLTYLAGSVSSDLGRQRIDNGTAFPWSRQFDSIYIEICDSDGIFLTDSQRGAYVSYVIGLIRQSRYFPEIRDRVVFLDGMDYEGGIILSNADYHSREIVFGNTDYSGAYEDASLEAVRSAGHSSDTGEFVSGLVFDQGCLPSTSAEAVEALLSENASFVRMSMVDLTFSPRPVDSESDLIFAGDSAYEDARGSADRMLLLLDTVRNLSMIGHSQDLYREVLDPLNTNQGQTAAQFSSDCTVRLIENEEKVYLIVANHSDTRQQFLLMSGSYPLVGSDILRYGPDGQFMLKRHVLWIDRRQTIGPGEYLIIDVQ